MTARLIPLGALVGLAALLTVTIAPAQQRAEGPAGAVSEGRGVPVFNPVEGRARALSIRPEGARVEKGETVCELDPADLKDGVASQVALVHGLRAGVEGQRLAREAAVMELNHYKDGRFAQELKAIDAEIQAAKAALVRAQDNAEWAGRMFQKGYSTKAEKVAADLAIEKAKYALELAQAKRDEPARHTRETTVRKLMAAVEAAREGELTKQAALLRAEAALKKLHQQVDGCKVAAPVAGRIRYDAAIGPGAVLHDGQLLFRIVPDAAPAAAGK
jgi:multidrug resistance efflux pump